jgi:molybdopterin-guanine dinucleotide biosynthesis protein
MTVMTDALIPALEDVREAHTAVIDRFRADMALTPVGPHRQTLQRHVHDTEDHMDRIGDHLREIRPRTLLRNTSELVRSVSDGAVRTARVPLEIGAVIAGSLLRAGRQTTERELLKTAEGEYAAAARALMACRAGESIAVVADDEEAVDLLASLRRQNEQLMQRLQDSVEEQARALAANGSLSVRGNGGPGAAASQAVRTVIARIREAARTGGQQTRRTAAGTARETTSVTRMAEHVQGAVTREEDLPISGYSRLTTTDIIQRLHDLSQSDLTVIEGFERAHANRSSVLDAIEDLRGRQPWPNYDAMSADEIAAHLQSAEPALARQVLDYEQQHRQRDQVVAAARQHPGATTL